MAAAASLEYSYKDKLIPMFTEKYPWITVEGTYDSSGKLQTQIEEGLEADVFMSAATKQMNALKDESLIDADSIVDLLENKIVLIAPAGSEPAAKSFETVTDAATIAVGRSRERPRGPVLQGGVHKSGQSGTRCPPRRPGHHRDRGAQLGGGGQRRRGASSTRPTRRRQPRCRSWPRRPEGSLEKKVVYPVGIVSASQHKDAARLFVEFLQSDEALTVFEEYGFTPNK